MQVDSVKIESEDDGFWLCMTLSGDAPAELWDALGESYGLRLHIHGVAVELLQEVERTIGPWHREGEQVYREFMRHVAPDDDSGYRLDDPKHPTYHERMADLYDDRSEDEAEAIDRDTGPEIDNAVA